MVIYKLVVGHGKGNNGAFAQIPSVLSDRITTYLVPALLALFFVIVAGGVIWWRISSGATRVIPDHASVAVLPFANLSSEKENETLCDGLTEEIIGALAEVKGLRVPSRLAVFAYKGKNESATKVGRELGVRRLLEGSIRRSENKLRISVRLINVVDGYQIWAQTYDRSLADVFAIQTEIAQRVIHATHDQFGVAEEAGGMALLETAFLGTTEPPKNK